MKYRGIEYTVVQGIARQVWKWSVSVAGVVINGRAKTRSDAVTNAERAIDRALAPKKRRVVPPDIPRGKYIGEAVDPAQRLWGDEIPHSSFSQNRCLYRRSHNSGALRGTSRVCGGETHYAFSSECGSRQEDGSSAKTMESLWEK